MSYPVVTPYEVARECGLLEEVYGSPDEHEAHEYLGRLSVLEERVDLLRTLLNLVDPARADRADTVKVVRAAENARGLWADVESAEGTHTYRVYADFPASQIARRLNVRCSCPDTPDVACKHAIAVARRFVAVRSGEVESGELSGL